ncbi:hypothetical protein AQUCO_00700877v1 [Aquilegia coerulea]|uniref:Cyclin N-terminal domain-containing protein n=1 Tax=Aquilegia coerulea TaxID=218851 RepID=A0A2G5EM28_AQUCA|nr:hypothetical protein AQUCO_00700877v1 [Aquilegia coerulea]PIA56827.1 hypothetical protein AQUCO_00700877v1 [Aquilegia coerulea]
MNRSDENNPALVRPKNLQGGARMGVGKVTTEIGRNRRALSTINPNLVGTQPCAVVNKRGLQERKNAVNIKNPSLPVNRPITRKFAAQSANKHQPSSPFKILSSQEAKKQKPSIEKPSEPDDLHILDVEEYQAGGDLPVPMSVKRSESMIVEIDEMEEVEMEEPVTDIDCRDSSDPLAVVEYIDDIYSYFRKAESSGCVLPNYMEQQFDINERMRAILIDWLIEVHYKFELMDETLFLMVNLIDRFLARQTVERKKLQLVGVTALLLACKYEEVSVPIVEDLIVITDKAYTRKEVLDMEKLMVNKLQFNMCVPTPYVFMRRFLKAAECDKKLEFLSFFMVELCLVEYEMLRFRPSLLAAAAIYTAQSTINGFKHWSKTSEWYTNYSEDQLLECSRMMVAFHQKAATGKLSGVHRKYSMFKFGYAAKSEPALFLLETRL